MFVDVVKTCRFVWGWHSKLQQELLFHHLWSGRCPLMFVSLGFASVLTLLNSFDSTMTSGVQKIAWTQPAAMGRNRNMGTLPAPSAVADAGTSRRSPPKTDYKRGKRKH